MYSTLGKAKDNIKALQDSASGKAETISNLHIDNDELEQENEELRKTLERLSKGKLNVETPFSDDEDDMEGTPPRDLNVPIKTTTGFIVKESKKFLAESMDPDYH